MRVHAKVIWFDAIKQHGIAETYEDTRREIILTKKCIITSNGEKNYLETDEIIECDIADAFQCTISSIENIPYALNITTVVVH